MWNGWPKDGKPTTVTNKPYANGGGGVASYSGTNVFYGQKLAQKDDNTKKSGISEAAWQWNGWDADGKPKESKNDYGAGKGGSVGYYGTEVYYDQKHKK